MFEVKKKIRVVVIDDSPLVRSIVSDLLQSEGDIEVIATGKTGVDCVELAERLRPDAITLDVEMPVMDGLTALQQIREKNIKVAVVMLSVLTQRGARATFQALELGAYDFVPKPSSAIKMDLQDIGSLLKAKIRGFFYEKKLQKPPKRIKVKVGNFPDIRKTAVEAVAIGASTGGPNALHRLFQKIPANFNLPIFIIQHMPAGFTKAFAERLDEFSHVKVKEAENGEVVQKGFAYLAPGDFHMKVRKREKNIYIELDKGQQVNGHRPSVDVTLESLLTLYNSGMIGIIMTGMGKDGATSMKKIKEAGAATIAQDEKTSVIYGMNRQAIEFGAIDSVVPLDEIVPNIIRIIKERGN
ncbi:MAG: chemotaxis response regulator protein-glutamate methylesterase [Spirochaetota bacterium]